MTPTTNNSTKSLVAQLTLAGAAALAGSAANAQIIVTNVNKDIGFAPGDLNSYTTTLLPGTNQLTFQRSASFTFSGFSTARFLGIKGAGSFLKFKSSNSSGVAILPAGRRFGTVVGNSTNFATVVANFYTSGASSASRGTFNDQYILFKFKDTTNSSQLDYGYIKLSLTDNTFGDPLDPNGGLTLHISDIAYDASGAQIVTGAPASVPEPAAPLALAALTALSLGAVGVRRIKALQN